MRRVRRVRGQIAAARPLLRQRRVTQRPVKPGHVVPSAELAADGLEGADEFEADAAVQGDAGVVGQCDAGVGVAVALERQLFEQPQVEPATDTWRW